MSDVEGSVSNLKINRAGVVAQCKGHRCISQYGGKILLVGTEAPWKGQADS